MICDRLRLTIAALLGALLLPGVAQAQTHTQLWTNFTFDWIKSKRVTFGVDAEPKVLLSAPSGDPWWATLDVTPSFEYSRGEWFDAVSELLVGRTRQTDDVNSTEVTPRIGFRLHLLSNLRNALEKEKRPKRRLVIRDLARLEWRNLWYSNDQPMSWTLRFRNRVEALWSLNRSKVTDDGAFYLQADDEWFWPLDEPDERYAYKERVRAGLGYRRSFAWRFEALYVLDRSRKSASESFSTSDRVVELTMKRVW
jgi:hypothetical protein